MLPPDAIQREAARRVAASKRKKRSIHDQIRAFGKRPDTMGKNGPGTGKTKRPYKPGMYDFYEPNGIRST